MKRCPVCNLDVDDAAAFCAHDGYGFNVAGSEGPALEALPDAAPLSTLISADAPLEVGPALQLAVSICEAVEAVHREGRAVGSLSPQDVLIPIQERPAKKVQRIVVPETANDPSARERRLREAADYISPEFARSEATRGEPVDFRSDVYSIGAILYEMLTGRTPFKASSPAAVVVKQLLERPRPPRDLRPEIPDAVQQVVLRALEKEKPARQQSCAELRREIEAAIEQRDSSGAATGESITSPPPEVSGGALTGIIAGVPQFCPVCGGTLSGDAFCRYCGSPPAAAMTVGMPAAAPPLSSAPPERDSAPAAPSANYAPRLDAPVRARKLNPAESTPISSAPSSRRLVLIPLLLIFGALFALSIALYTYTSSGPTSSAPPIPQAPGGGSGLAFLVLSLLGIFGVLGGAAVAYWYLRRRRVARDAVRAEADRLPGPALPTTMPVPSLDPAYRGVPPAPGVPVQPGGQARPDVAESVVTVRVEPPVRHETIRRCPTCETEFPLSVRFCVRDGTALKEERKPVPEDKGPSFYDLQAVEISKQCPRCQEEYPASKKHCRFDGQALVEVRRAAEQDHQPEAMEPIVIGQYSCFARLGEGGMGVVYKARHIHLERLSAVKVLLPQTSALLPNAAQMFRREARLASSINHPNSVIIYDYGELGATLLYLAMEFIPGKSLAEILRPKQQPARRLPLLRALDITRQIGQALDAAHHADIVHRDLKPQNVMVCKLPNGKDHVKVVDFGVARSLTRGADYRTTPGAILGTPAYMSPEQASGLPDLDARSDIFSLGLMVYEMLSGVLPLKTQGLTPMQVAVERAALRSPPPALRDSQPDLQVPAALDRVLTRALEPDRSRRTQSIRQFMDELEAVFS